MTNKKADVFSKFIIVEPHHLDELKHVNNGVYVKWIQEIAREHWLSKNPSVNSDTAYLGGYGPSYSIQKTGKTQRQIESGDIC